MSEKFWADEFESESESSVNREEGESERLSGL